VGFRRHRGRLSSNTAWSCFVSSSRPRIHNLARSMFASSDCATLEPGSERHAWAGACPRVGGGPAARPSPARGRGRRPGARRFIVRTPMPPSAGTLPAIARRRVTRPARSARHPRPHRAARPPTGPRCRGRTAPACRRRGTCAGSGPAARRAAGSPRPASRRKPRRRHPDAAAPGRARAPRPPRRRIPRCARRAARPEPRPRVKGRRVLPEPQRLVRQRGSDRGQTVFRDTLVGPLPFNAARSRDEQDWHYCAPDGKENPGMDGSVFDHRRHDRGGGCVGA
jgi:hypothetical protein